MKIFLLCSSQGNQRALASKLHSAVGIQGLVIFGARQTRASQLHRLSVSQLWQKACSVSIGYAFRKSWMEMLRYYDQRYPAFPIRPAIECTDINSAAVLQYISKERPDLVLVSGTNLLKAPLIQEIQKHGAVMNLHTGISPYVKGGPNCTNWCLALREFWLIGSTVMWIDPGIDSGNIIATEQAPLTGAETFTGLQIRVMEHAHSLYVRCVARYARGHTLNSVPQASFPVRRLFLTKQWRPGQMLRARVNYALHYRPGSPYLRAPVPLMLLDVEGETTGLNEADAASVTPSPPA